MQKEVLVSNLKVYQGYIKVSIKVSDFKIYLTFKAL